MRIALYLVALLVWFMLGSWFLGPVLLREGGGTAWLIGGESGAGVRTPWSVTGTAQPLKLTE